MGKHIAVYVSASSGSRDTASQEADLLRWSHEGPRWVRPATTARRRARNG